MNIKKKRHKKNFFFVVKKCFNNKTPIKINLYIIYRAKHKRA